MNWWSRIWSSDEEAPAADVEDILVISDIHLGEDILTEGPEYLSEYIRLLNRELAQFIASHRQQRQVGHRWHLVINGDMFDFVKISLRPEAGEAHSRWERELQPEELARGLENTPEHVVWKLERIFEIHRPLFKQMALFLLDGNRVTFVEGNHDAEFYFDEVRETLHSNLVSLAAKMHRREGRSDAFDASLVGEAIAFSRWFVAVPGVYHIEHGHQYDAECSFEYALAPHDAVGARTLATPVTHRMIPYFAEMLGDFSTHGIEKWVFSDYLKFAFGRGPKMLLLLLPTYFAAVWDLVRRSGRKQQAARAELAKIHEARLRELGEQSSYKFETLQRLDGLKATPVENSILRTMNSLFLDRLLVLGLGGLVALLGVWLGGLFGLALAVLGTASGVGGLLGLAYLHPGAAYLVLRGAAHKIAATTGARYVVFGHSHHPEVVALNRMVSGGSPGDTEDPTEGPAGVYYLNSGSWVTREVLQGEAGSGMTYVQIDSQGAALRAWRGVGLEPDTLVSTQSESAPGPDGVMPMQRNWPGRTHD